jgi:hypothetical protein
VICPLCFGDGRYPVVRVRSEDGSFVVTQELPLPRMRGQRDCVVLRRCWLGDSRGRRTAGGGE